MKKKETLIKTPPVEALRNEIIPDDRLGPDEPVDEASLNGQENLQQDDPTGHRITKFEEDDEHNSEILTQEGLQGFMHESLTKPRKTKSE